MDYINASWITTSKRRESIEECPINDSSCSKISFIASQGPLPSSCAHHLQMIHEQKIDVVVMLSNLEEGLTSCQGKKINDDIETEWYYPNELFHNIKQLIRLIIFR